MKFSVLLQYITPHRRVLLAVMALLLASSATAPAQPWRAMWLIALPEAKSKLNFLIR
jgi:hypothetical protein